MDDFKDLALAIDDALGTASELARELAERSGATDRTGAEATLQAALPLMAQPKRAAEIFDLSVTTLDRLRRRYPDFRALTVKAGGALLYDVPKCYEWFSRYLGTAIEVQ